MGCLLARGMEDKCDLRQVACSPGKKFRFLCGCGGRLSRAECSFSGTTHGGGLSFTWALLRSAWSICASSRKVAVSDGLKSNGWKRMLRSGLWEGGGWQHSAPLMRCVPQPLSCQPSLSMSGVGTWGKAVILGSLPPPPPAVGPCWEVRSGGCCNVHDLCSST